MVLGLSPAIMVISRPQPKKKAAKSTKLKHLLQQSKKLDVQQLKKYRHKVEVLEGPCSKGIEDDTYVQILRKIEDPSYAVSIYRLLEEEYLETTDLYLEERNTAISRSLQKKFERVDFPEAGIELYHYEQDGIHGKVIHDLKRGEVSLVRQKEPGEVISETQHEWIKQVKRELLQEIGKDIWNNLIQLVNEQDNEDSNTSMLA